MFNNPTIQSTINQFNGNSFGDLHGFRMYSSFNIAYYYVIDFGANRVYILNGEWKFISSKTFSNPLNMISISNSLYMTGDYNVWKVDQDLNILINCEPIGDNPGYTGII